MKMGVLQIKSQKFLFRNLNSAFIVKLICGFNFADYFVEVA
jgi:hypothetical protein